MSHNQRLTRILAREEQILKDTLTCVTGHEALIITSDHKKRFDQMSVANLYYVSGFCKSTVLGARFGEDALPFRPKSIDVLICYHALSWVTDIDAFCRQIAAVLAPGGKAFIIDFAPSFNGKFLMTQNNMPWHSLSPSIIKKKALQADLKFEKAYHYGLSSAFILNLCYNFVPMSASFFIINIKKCALPVDPIWDRETLLKIKSPAMSIKGNSHANQ